MSDPIKNVVLVHGAFVDGSGWRGVYDTLSAAGFRVRVMQIPTQSLEADVGLTGQVLDDIDGEVVLVGHCYGGVIITEAGRHPNVAALVYLAAFAPAEGESVSSLMATPPPGAAVPPILALRDGNLLLDRDRFHASFAADLSPQQAAFMADSQVPWGVAATQTAVSDPAWRTKPTCYLVASNDRMIPPPLQRAMADRAGATVTELPASHSVYLSQPRAVALLIEQAAG